MSYKVVTGDMFDGDYGAYVNACNCVGINGGGLAYQFKKLFPDMDKDFRAVCKKGWLFPGRLHHFQVCDNPEQYVINFPTKNKLEYDGDIEYIKMGLPVLEKLLLQLRVKTVAIPALGAGYANIDWTLVKPLILEQFKNSSVEAYVFEPWEQQDNEKIE